MKSAPLVAALLATAALVGSGAAADFKMGKASPPTSIAAANNDFAFALYEQAAKGTKGKNLFFSPWSITNALLIVAEGARGETALEMGKAMRLPASTRNNGKDAELIPWTLAPLHQSLAALNKRFEAAARPVPRKQLERLAALRKALRKANDGAREGSEREAARAKEIADQVNELQARMNPYELRLANALWAEKSYPFRPSYLATISKHHGIGAFPVDFRKGHEEVRRRINSWVQEKTRGRIKDLIPQGAVTRATRLVVSNAVYFKGQWVEPFGEGQTREQPFTLADGKKVQAPLMHREGMNATRYAAFRHGGTFFDTPLEVPSGGDPKKLYPDARGFEVLELPYKGGQLSMVVILPRSAGGLSDLEKKLTGSNLRAWTARLRQRSVNVFLPKFRMTTPFDLKEALVALGLKRAFTDPRRQGGAQFEGMSKAREPEDKLFVTAALHKAFIDVSEKGTEAAAATAVIQDGGGADASEPFTPTFRADRPFVFLIRDKQSGAVLFLGRVMNPKSAG
jgi:serine protease inhibitor